MGLIAKKYLEGKLKRTLRVQECVNTLRGKWVGVLARVSPTASVACNRGRPAVPRHHPSVAECHNRPPTPRDFGHLPNTTSATYPTCLETWTKESNTYTSQRESRTTVTTPTCSESRGWPRRDPRHPREAAGGVHRWPVLSSSVGQVKQERARGDPKDGELCPGRGKPKETLARCGPDVQIGHPIWV